ncbi:MAG: hypothetical protein PXY39_00320 [archaeon]|nr:hypothetical protein [archaeon]
MMITTDNLLILLSTLSNFQIGGGLLSSEGPIEFILDIATGGFSFVLFAITLYAWSKRSRQPTLLFVSFGFLAFFIKQLVGVLPLDSLHGELFGSVMDFATLALFFVGLVVRPRRREIIANSDIEEAKSLP